VHTSILYVSRAINEEATVIMYNTVQIALRAPDVFGLRPKFLDFEVPKAGIWRFDPTKGTGDPNEKGDRRYLGVGIPRMDVRRSLPIQNIANF